MKNATTEELLTRVTISLAGRVSLSAVSARDAHAELARRLRELVPLLETALCHLNTPTVARRQLNKAIALATGGEEKR